MNILDKDLQLNILFLTDPSFYVAIINQELKTLITQDREKFLYQFIVLYARLRREIK